MAYCSVAEIREYLGISATTDDGLLAMLRDGAQKAIDGITGRVFEASADTTRYYTVGEDTDGLTLYFDCDFCALTTVKTNADAAVATTITSSYYTTIPRNTTPYYGIKILSSSGYTWEYTNNPEKGIEITGKAAYSTTAPYDIRQAAGRLAAYFYRQKDAGVYDVTAIPDAGIIQVPQGIPRDVMLLLKRYTKAI